MFRKVEINKRELGNIYLSSMPGRYERIEDFIIGTAKYKIDKIVCLCSMNEIENKSVGYTKLINKNLLHIEKFDYPIDDYGIPNNIESFIKFLTTVSNELYDKETILIHCAGGKGRTGLFTICLLLKLGFKLDEATELVFDADASPDTPEQRKFIEKINKIGLDYE